MVREQATVQVSNSIIWGNSGDQLYVYPGATFTMTYSDSQPYPGIGNISVDPLFAAPATDDYHLKSVRGRWNPALAQWVTDKVHSPCIDKGNPAAAFDQEPIPNRSRTNMGVYGNTPEASKSRASLEAMFAVAAPGKLRRGIGGRAAPCRWVRCRSSRVIDSIIGLMPRRLLYRPRIIFQKVGGFFSLPFGGGRPGWG